MLNSYDTVYIKKWKISDLALLERDTCKLTNSTGQEKILDYDMK
jgi:hypothetical protein